MFKRDVHGWVDKDTLHFSPTLLLGTNSEFESLCGRLFIFFLSFLILWILIFFTFTHPFCFLNHINDIYLLVPSHQVGGSIMFCFFFALQFGYPQRRVGREGCMVYGVCVCVCVCVCVYVCVWGGAAASHIVNPQYNNWLRTKTWHHIIVVMRVLLTIYLFVIVECMWCVCVGWGVRCAW